MRRWRRVANKSQRRDWPALMGQFVAAAAAASCQVEAIGPANKGNDICSIRRPRPRHKDSTLMLCSLQDFSPAATLWCQDASSSRQQVFWPVRKSADCAPDDVVRLTLVAPQLVAAPPASRGPGQFKSGQSRRERARRRSLIIAPLVSSQLIEKKRWPNIIALDELVRLLFALASAFATGKQTRPATLARRHLARRHQSRAPLVCVS